MTAHLALSPAYLEHLAWREARDQRHRAAAAYDAGETNHHHRTRRRIPRRRPRHTASDQ